MEIIARLRAGASNLIALALGSNLQEALRENLEAQQTLKRLVAKRLGMEVDAHGGFVELNGHKFDRGA